MLTDGDRRGVRNTFGADDAQVERDHLISHALAAISDGLGDRVQFYGGTALARSFLPDGRLSEDIDLIAVGSRVDVADDLTRALTRRLARDFGRPEFRPPLATVRATQAVSIAFPSGPTIQIQLLPGDHYPAWPFERRELAQRYDDVGPASLLVPTLDAFVAWKTVAFIDRRASRDLWDLAALAAITDYSRTAAALFARFGPFAALPSNATIPAAPRENDWRRDLAHQTRLSLTAEQARAAVVRAWARSRAT